jgi:AraC-like DNA-binding protein/mannose-6-phosphate isomerase-like protein (cupin superfamily)
MTTAQTFLAIGAMTVDPAWRMQAHRHDCNELLIVMRGRMAAEGDHGVKLRAGPGDVLLYPAGARHAEVNDAQAPIEMVFMSFRGAVGRQMCVVHDHDARIRTLAGWLLQSRAATYVGARRQEASLMEAVREEFLRLRSRPDVNPLVEHVRAFVYKNLAQPISLKQLAACANMSEFHFIRSYKKASSFTPMNDARRIRLEEARKTILTTGLPLRAIADSTGFANEYHFSQAFKRHFGSPPGAFRK